MFIVYSPEGQKAIAASNLKLNYMKVAKSKPDIPLGESGLEKENIKVKSEIPAQNSEAIKKYIETESPEHGHVIVTVEEIMTRDVFTINASDSIESAWKIMQDNNIDHLPVYGITDTLIGLISIKDILLHFVVKGGVLEGDTQYLVSDLMNPKVISTQLKTNIRQVALAMSEFSVGCILVVNELSDLLGIVSSHDLIKRLAENPPVTLFV